MTARRRKKPLGPAVLADPAGCGGESRQRQSNLSTPTVPKSGGESSRWSRWVLSHAAGSSWLGACEPRPASGGLRGGGLSWWPGAGGLRLAACGVAAWGLAACLVVGRRVDSCLVVACRGSWPRAGAPPTRAGGRRCPLRPGAMAVRGWRVGPGRWGLGVGAWGLEVEGWGLAPWGSAPGWPPPTRPATAARASGVAAEVPGPSGLRRGSLRWRAKPPLAGPVSPPGPPAPPATGSPPPRC
jgi:hypothetical protein